MKKNVLALGYFDSLHIGHRKLLSSALTYAKENGCRLTVATFNDGFLKAVRKGEKEVFLLEERKRILRSLGVEDVLVFPSDIEFLSQNKFEFCRYINGFDFEAVFVGTDYRFGKNAEGDAEYLRDNLTAKVFVEDIVCINNKKVSSSDIRRNILRGEMEEAALLLTQPYFIMGKVTRGRTDGRKMSLPTLNLLPKAEKELPLCGVYATETEFGGKKYLSVTNVGTHPTFGDETINVETHVLDFDGQIYDEEVTVYFDRFLRKIQKFDTMDELKRQIEKDIEFTKEYYYDKIRRSGQQQ